MKNKDISRQHSFLRWQARNWREENLFPPELEHKDAINFLVDYLLGEDWYFVNPVNAKQGNVYIVHEILGRYSRKYRSEIRRYKRRMKKRNKLK